MPRQSTIKSKNFSLIYPTIQQTVKTLQYPIVFLSNRNDLKKLLSYIMFFVFPSNRSHILSQASIMHTEYSLCVYILLIVLGVIFYICASSVYYLSSITLQYFQFENLFDLYLRVVSCCSKLQFTICFITSC